MSKPKFKVGEIVIRTVKSKSRNSIPGARHTVKQCVGRTVFFEETGDYSFGASSYTSTGMFKTIPLSSISTLNNHDEGPTTYKIGDKVEALINQVWVKTIYLGYVKGSHYPYITVMPATLTDYHAGIPFDIQKSVKVQLPQVKKYTVEQLTKLIGHKFELV